MMLRKDYFYVKLDQVLKKIISKYGISLHTTLFSKKMIKVDAIETIDIYK